MKKYTTLMIALTVTLLLLSNQVQANPKPAETRGTVLYVSSGSFGACTSWADTCDLQAALTAAVATDEIWVAEGTYLPRITGYRSESFTLKNGVAIYGGFAGTETSREQRDWVSNITILSGDIGTLGDSSDNSYHVLYCVQLDASAILDGFTITAGNTYGSTSGDNGGGMFNDDQSSPTLNNITFTDNFATRGGGMFNFNFSSPTLFNVIFSSNSADEDGGGLYNDNSSPTLTNVTFTNNSASYGGGIYNFESSPTLLNVTFSTNTASSGGGMNNAFDSSPTLFNVTFTNNSAASDGGGIYNYNESNPMLTNVTFSLNTASRDGGGIYNLESSPTLFNTILWGNTPDQIFNLDSIAIITYSDIQGGYAGEGNINLDPLLGPLADNGGFTQTHALLAGSPAIDTGSPTICPTTDQRGFPRPTEADGDEIPECDMGAYEAHQVIFVDEDALGLDNGTSWTDAFTDLQDALGIANAGDQVWVAEGTYLPSTTGDRSESFQLTNGVEIYGGFAGTETALEQRNWHSNDTILSGNIGLAKESSDNSYHVVYGTEIDATAILDGFTITAGNANGTSLTDRGAGMFNILNSNPTLSNLFFTENSAIYGGGMYSDNSSPTLTDVTFVSNSATTYAGGMYNNHASPTLTNARFSLNTSDLDGGGIFNNNNSDPMLTNVIISSNAAKGDGGGMYNWDRSDPTLTNVTFSANSSTNGGGMYNKDDSNPVMPNTTFSNNAASFKGGGIYNYQTNLSTLTNVTFSANTAVNEGGGLSNNESTITLINAILWGNTPDQMTNNFSTVTITYSDIQGGYTGQGNINLDPLLGPLADNGGFTLTHALLPGSPAIDTGSPTVCPTTDQRGVTRPIDGNWDLMPRCDMGAYEYEPVIYYNYLPLILH